ncbi:MAG: hypothetical protein LBQ09_00315 [Acidobacteriaceae bacterium]|nr:hypothetical protein [Acidobacteriaceae bacterium]
MTIRVQSVMAAWCVLAGAALMFIASAPLHGQQAAPSAPYRAPRGADGHPDLNGIWQALNTANYDIETHAARPAMALRSGPYGPLPAPQVLALGAVGAVPGGLGVVDGGEIPYLPAALEQKKKNQENWLTLDPEIKCYLPGVPRATYMPFPFQIFQSSTAIFIAYEYAGATRNLYLKAPGPPPIDAWMGQSVAHWEGDTLVVTVNGFNGETWFDRAGNFHSEAMTVTERYTRTSPDIITYEATIDDPNTFSRPWTMRMPLYRRQEKNMQLMDFKCVEFVEELMYGQWRKDPLPR